MDPTAPTPAHADELELRASPPEEEAPTLRAVEDRLSIKKQIRASSEAIGAAASRATRWSSPEATTLIRLDHTHVLAAFRRYRHGASAERKRALVANACLALEIHAQLEEEIFYPALFAAGVKEDELDQSITEHDEIRSYIQRLRRLSPGDGQYDGVYYELIRKALHHIADEETILLPLAEIRLKGQLRELGWQMTVRRLELLKPRAAEAASTTAVTFPVLTGVAVAGLCAGVWLLVRGATARA